MLEIAPSEVPNEINDRNEEGCTGNRSKNYDRAVRERAGGRKPPDRGVMHVETVRDVHLRLASTQALDSFLPLVLRELSRPAEPHTTILGALAALASARSDQAYLPGTLPERLHLPLRPPAVEVAAAIPVKLQQFLSSFGVPGRR